MDFALYRYEIEYYQSMQKAWNIPNSPVYSLASYNHLDAVNMNICTYVSAISMKPKLYAIAVYNNTKTLDNIEQGDTAVLQLLHESQYGLVNKLGKASGRTYDKYNYLFNKNALTYWNEFVVLRNCSALVLLKKINAIQTGDHKLFVFELEKSKVFNTDYLQLNTLRQKKIIRG